MIPSPQVNFSPSGNTGQINSGNAYSENPDLFQVLLQQNMNNAFDILFDTKDDESSSGSIFPSMYSDQTAQSQLFGSTADMTSLLSNVGGGQSTYFSGTNPAAEMIAKANLIGKTVDAVDPTTNQTFTGQVKSVQVEGGVLLIEVGDKKVPPENLIKISE
jgi:hypothetical protein